VAFELVLIVAVVVLAVALVIVSRREQRIAGYLRQIAETFGTTSDGPSIVTGAEKLQLRVDRLETQLVRDTDDMATLGEALPIGLVRFGTDGHVDLATPSAHALLARPGRSLLGRSVMETFADTRADALVGAAASGANPSTTPLELALRGPGTPMLALRARRSPSGATWVLIEDVTELRNLQRIRAEFVDNVSHELRTPLSTVSLLAETLAREAEAADVPPKMKDRIGKIEVEMGHLVQMVTELLDLSRIEAGTSLSMAGDVDLGRLATSSTERLRLFAERNGVTLRVDLEPDLPRVRADEDRIGQVFVNLVHNAVKFSPDGGEVLVRVRHVDDVLAASVEDHGVGIPRRAQARIFERFYKLDRSRARPAGGGTGLGLSIVRHIVEQHGGRITVESKEGRGSTFTFTIPLASPVDVPPALPTATAAR
jgi:two-component system, OmpR family, phosphate regulon sensor histidine kinase PhoR